MRYTGDMLIDTHCHIHDTEFYHDTREEVYRQSIDAGVTMICVGTDLRSSLEAIEFCRSHRCCYAVVGIHPHEAATNDVRELQKMVDEHRSEIVGIGEIGLDYFYDHSPRDVQMVALRAQLAIAKVANLPVSFHVREAFADFWPIFDEFPGIRGALHSFTDTKANLDEGLRRGLFIGVNGISTFTKDKNQQQMYAELPLKTIVLETDAPFLTPAPFRGKMNVPAYVERVAAHQATLKGVAIDEVARQTSANAEAMFGIKTQ